MRFLTFQSCPQCHRTYIIDLCQSVFKLTRTFEDIGHRILGNVPFLIKCATFLHFRKCTMLKYYSIWVSFILSIRICICVMCVHTCLCMCVLMSVCVHEYVCVWRNVHINAGTMRHQKNVLHPLKLGLEIDMNLLMRVLKPDSKYMFLYTLSRLSSTHSVFTNDLQLCKEEKEMDLSEEQCCLGESPGFC